MDEKSIEKMKRAYAAIYGDYDDYEYETSEERKDADNNGKTERDKKHKSNQS